MPREFIESQITNSVINEESKNGSNRGTLSQAVLIAYLVQSDWVLRSTDHDRVLVKLIGYQRD